MIVPAALYRRDMDWIEFQMHCAKAFDKPVIVLEPFGGTDTIAPAVQELADEVVPWDQRQLVDAIKRAGASRRNDALRRDRVQARLRNAGTSNRSSATVSAFSLATMRRRGALSFSFERGEEANISKIRSGVRRGVPLGHLPHRGFGGRHPPAARAACIAARSVANRLANAPQARPARAREQVARRMRRSGAASPGRQPTSTCIAAVKFVPQCRHGLPLRSKNVYDYQ